MTYPFGFNLKNDFVIKPNKKAMVIVLDALSAVVKT